MEPLTYRERSPFRLTTGIVVTDGNSSLFVIRIDLRQRLRADSGQEFNVTNHGAIADGKTRFTDVIQEAIDATTDAGGGVVVVPRKDFLTGTLFVKSDIELRLANGSVLRAVPDNDAHPNRPTQVAGIGIAVGRRQCRGDARPVWRERA